MGPQNLEDEDVNILSSGVLSHGSNSTPNQLFTPWQESNQEDNLNVKDINAEVKRSHTQEQTSSDEEMTQRGSCSENQEQPVGYLQEHSQLQPKDDQLKQHGQSRQFSNRSELLLSYFISGANNSNYHPHPYSIGASSTSLEPQNQDLEIKLFPLHEGILPNQSGGTTQPMSSMSVQDYDRQHSCNEPNRLQDGSFSHLTIPSTLQQNQLPCQSSSRNDKVGGSLAYIKQEVPSQNQDQHVSQSSSSSSSTSLSSQKNAVASGANAIPVFMPTRLDSRMPDYGSVSGNGYGTTNIISIFGGIIIVAVDSRITSNGRLRTDYHEKLFRYGHDIFGTMCGGRRLSQRLRDYLQKTIREKEDIYTVQSVATLAHEWLIDEVKEAEKSVGPEPPKKGEMPPKDDENYPQWALNNPQYISWDEKYTHYLQQYAYTVSFIFGFESQTPKVYIVNGLYGVPADISKDFNLDQYIKGITKEMDEAAGYLTSFPHHHVLGSSRPLIRVCMENSAYFKRLKEECDIAVMSHEEKTFARRRTFTIDAIEYAKVITFACMHDSFTGGNIVVKMVSKGISEDREYNTAEIYLRNFDELEYTPVILFVIKASGNQNWAVDLFKGFLRDRGCPDKLFHLGTYNDYCFYRHPLETELKDLIPEISSKTNRADFGLPEILRVGSVSWLACEPTSEIVKTFLVL